MTSESTFTNREIAIGIWSLLLISWIAFKRDLRPSLKGLLRSFLQRQILIIYGLMIAYVLLAVWLLHYLNLWESRQLKDTVVWFIVVAATSIFRLPKSADDVVYFKDAFLENLKLIAIIEFIISFFPGSLAFELVLVPFSTALAVTIVVAERDKRLAIAATILNWFASALGASLLSYAIYRLATNIFGFATLDTLVDFSLSATLTAVFLPFIFFMTVFTNYETDFVMVDRAIKDKKLSSYAKRQAMRRFGWRTSLVKRWRRGLFLAGYHTRCDIDKSITSVLERYARERNPPYIAKSDGWSPYAAKAFLADDDLEAGYYEPTVDEKWYASKIRNVSDKDSLSSIEYWIEGDSIRATTLCLELNAYQHEARLPDIKEFILLASKLYAAALGQAMAAGLAEEVLTKDAVEQLVDGKVVSSTNKPWGDASRGGFTLELRIAVPQEQTHASTVDSYL